MNEHILKEKARIFTNIQNSYINSHIVKTPEIAYDDFEKLVKSETGEPIQLFYTKNVIDSYQKKVLESENKAKIEKADNELKALMQVNVIYPNKLVSIMYPAIDTSKNEYLDNPINSFLNRKGKV